MERLNMLTPMITRSQRAALIVDMEQRPRAWKDAPYVMGTPDEHTILFYIGGAGIKHASDEQANYLKGMYTYAVRAGRSST